MTLDGAHQGHDDPFGLDDRTIRRLLALAGPSDAPELMRRLISDLRGVTAGLMTQDCAALRKHSHVLLAIAGTIGAHRIHSLAAHLNRCAKDTDCTHAKPEAVDLMQLLDGLIARLHVMAAELGPEV